MTTAVNLLGLLHQQVGSDIFTTDDAGLSREAFTTMVEGLVDAVDHLPWLWFGAAGELY